jgi:acyl carrier protein
MSIETKLRGFILENFLFTDDQDALANDTSFLAEGILNSTGIMEVVLFVEEEFDIAVADEDMVPENLDSIDALEAFIRRRQAG